ncbi:signal-regulatory protein beta-2-like [Sceloporus undulatus]|uniref:signal-regulatory protein beta-2-like n=1 Tax=Sceloporus undulatus TaxID=8520 RepID=UPI001C4AB83B|nr:signal-regulatory protein beta-2-like [Sceloporus undulatus]
MDYSFAEINNPQSQSRHGTQVIVQSIEKQMVVQPQDFVSVLTGESLKLECWVEGGLPSGPMKWFLGNGTDRKVIYEDALAPGRVTRNQKSSLTDFTIVIHNVTDKDAGTYYCGMEKRLKRNGGPDWKIGSGTQVAVKSEW